MATFFLSYPMLSAFWLQQVLKLPSGYQPNFSNNIGLQETKYPLVNSHITMGHHHVINGKIKYFDCSSQTVSHYQRVSPLYFHFLKDQQSPCFVKKLPPLSTALTSARAETKTCTLTADPPDSSHSWGSHGIL